MARTPASRVAKKPKGKVVLEFSVLDDKTKKRIASCIERSGKVTVTMTSVGKSDVGPAGFAQKID